MKTFAEQIAEQLELRKEKFAALEGINEKSVTESRVFTEDESNDFDALKGEIEAIDAQIERLKDMEKMAAKNAEPYTPTPAAPAAPAAGVVTPTPGQVDEFGKSYDIGDSPRIKGEVDNIKKLDKGILFARIAIAKAVARHQGISPSDVASMRWSETMGHVMRGQMMNEMQFDKAIVPAGVTTVPEWAGELVDEATTGFIDMLRAESILTKLPMREMSFGDSQGIRIPALAQGTVAGYVGEAHSIKASQMQFDAVNLFPYKLACLVPVSSELLRRSNPDIERLVRDDLILSAAIVADRQYIDGVPTPGVAPGGITLGLPATHTKVAAGGAAPTVAEVTTDLGFCITALRSSNIPMSGAAWILSERTRTYLMMQRDSNDTFAWRDEIVAGTLLGYPIVSSTTVPTDMGAGSNESIICLGDFNQIIFAQGQAPTVDASTEATIQSDTAPDTPPDLAGGGQFSAFQQDSMILRLRLEHDWQKRHATCLATVTGVLY